VTTEMIKLAKLQHLADNAGTEGERAAALAAVARVKRRQMLAKVATACEPVPVDPFGERLEHKPSGPRPVAPLLPHQRMAWLCLAAGAGNLSRSENSFLHRMRESRYISPRQQDWLRDIDVRLRWEAGVR